MSYNTSILSPEVQDFIVKNEKTDLRQLALKKSPFAGVSSFELAQQIESRQKAKKKLPTWYNSKGVYYPKALSIEQTSSEITANFKRQLINPGESLIDLTGGFGVDAYYFTLSAGHVIHCEIDSQLSKIAQHNAQVLDQQNIHFLHGNGIDILKSTHDKFDTIYIDPARRVKTKKVFLLQDCEPNVIEHHATLLERAKHVLIKSSPLLDISQTLEQLKNIKEIYIISVKNECKELLVILSQDAVESPKIIAKLLTEKEETFSFYAHEEKEATATFSLAENYLYDPDAALLKAGSFKLISSHYQINKLHINTHIYTSAEKVENFPGRTFRVQKVVEYKTFKKEKNHLAASIVSKNFPINAATLRQKHKIAESATNFLFFCKTLDEKLQVIFAEKIP